MGNMIDIVKFFLLSVVGLTTFLLTTSTFAMLDGDNCVEGNKRARIQVDGLNVLGTLGNICDENKVQIIISVASNTYPGNLRLVCQDWRDLIDAGTELDEKDYYYPSPIWNTLNKLYYAPFFNLKFIFKPDLESDEGTISLGFSERCNPLKHTFDLSNCEEADKELIITTDLSTFFSNEKDSNFYTNDNGDKLPKLVILITSGTWVKQNIETIAHHFDPIMKEWNTDAAPMGIFWHMPMGCPGQMFDGITTCSSSFISGKKLSNIVYYNELPSPTYPTQPSMPIPTHEYINRYDDILRKWTKKFQIHL